MKSSFRWDFDLSKINKDLTKVVAKTVAGFLNAKGGILLIGVDDDDEVIGIEMDLATLKRQDKDGFEQVLRAGLATYLGPDVSPLVNLQFHEVGVKSIAVVTCPEHENPTFFRDGDRQEFYLRDGNLTRPLDVKSTHDYIRVHWHFEKQHEHDLEVVKEELLGAVPSLEDIRGVMIEILAGHGLPRGPLPATTQVLPAWLKVGTVRVLDLFLSSGEDVPIDRHEAFLSIATKKDVYTKIVVTPETDDVEVLTAVEMISRVAESVPLILQPVTPMGQIKTTPTVQRMLDLHEATLKIHKDVRVIPQVHALMGQL